MAGCPIAPEIVTVSPAKQRPRTRKPSTIPLNFSSADRVMVVPEDGDRFLTTADKAVDACKRVGDLEAEAPRSADGNEVIRRFDQKFLRPLRAWCEANAGRVLACYVPVPAGFLEVYIVGRSPKYDFDLGSEITRMELELVDQGWRVHSMMIPAPEHEDELRVHFDSDGALEVYADRQPTPVESRQESAVP